RGFALDLDRDDFALAVLAADHDEVADAALGQLALDRRHPRPAGAAIRPGRVQEDAGVADELAAIGALAPLVFDADAVVLVVLVGGDIAVPFARDVQDALAHGEDALGIFASAPLEPGGQPGQVLAVEELD